MDNVRTNIVAAIGVVAAGALLAVSCSVSTAPAPSPTPSDHTAASRAPAGRPAIAALTTRGGVVVLDPNAGVVVRTLTTVGTLGPGPGLAVSPDGATVYYTVADTGGCLDGIWSVPVAGRSSTRVALGDLPALSPDGSELAYARLPSANSGNNCAHAPSSYSVVVRRLRDGSETVYPLSPATAQSGLPRPISALSWAPDSRRLAVSLEAPEDNAGWRLTIVDTAPRRPGTHGPGVI